MAQQPSNLSAFSGIQQHPQNISLFPPPPLFAEQYTTENIKKGLVLPPPNLPTKFEVFSELCDLDGPLLPTLSELGCQQLYSGSGNWRAELKKLNRSLTAAFLDLIEILIRCPDHGDRLEKIDTIRNLFVNIHHLINEYRPVQARDTLRQMIIHQNQEIICVTEQLNRLTKMGSDALVTLKDALQNFSIEDAMPKIAFHCEDEMELMEDEQMLCAAPSETYEYPLTIEEKAQQLKPIEMPERVTRKDIPGVKMQLQREFARFSSQ
uniref:Mediator of RNA polymerase II transcription subunit 7 n=1 Tax=Globodera pallida TaxID=36090 RepID=A0A183C4B3_GLOPA